MNTEIVAKIECPGCKTNGTGIEYIDKIEGEKWDQEYTICNKYMDINKPFILLFKCNSCGNMFIVDLGD